MGIHNATVQDAEQARRELADKDHRSNWKNWVQTVGDANWYTNACVFATQKEAIEAGHELAGRWTAVENTDARPTDDPVNYRFNFETYRPESLKS